eukprot:5551582-Pyramimonas_sp.AAC.1
MQNAPKKPWISTESWELIQRRTTLLHQLRRCEHRVADTPPQDGPVLALPLPSLDVPAGHNPGEALA